MKQQYQSEPWFLLLRNAAQLHTRQVAAAQLGVSPPVVSQVLNGSGKYGNGQASTRKLGERVMHVYGSFACPHLSEQSADGQQVVLQADACRAYAHRPAPITSPRDMQHWQACNSCPHKALTAPPTPRAPRRRKPQETA